MSIEIEWAHQSITPKDVEGVTRALNQGLPAQLEQQLEEAFARYLSVPHAIAISSLGCAYQTLYAALQIGSADQLITTSCVPIAAIAPALARGARLHQIEQQQPELFLVPRRSRGRSILLISHEAGDPVPVDLIERQLTSPDDLVIEDASDALGALYRDGSRVGCCRWSRVTLFDLHARSITAGSGALVTTQDAALAAQLREQRHRTQAHLNPLAAALGLSQLDKLERFIKRRRHVMDWYRQRLLHPAITLPPAIPHSACAYLSLQIDWERFGLPCDQLHHRLLQKGIETRMPSSPNHILLPIYPALTEHKVDYICASLLACAR
jgi:dTDP-4-amino-4,6-dideoxygalactose transaminase